MALASAKCREGLPTTGSTVWTQPEAAIVAALAVGDVERVAAEFSSYGVERKQAEPVTAAILRRVGEIAVERDAAEFQRRVQAMAHLSQPEAFRAWLLAELFPATPPG